MTETRSTSRIPNPHRLCAGDRLIVDGSAAVVSGRTDFGGFYQIDLRVSDWPVTLYVRPDGTVMPGIPLKLARLFMSGVIK